MTRWGETEWFPNSSRYFPAETTLTKKVDGRFIIIIYILGSSWKFDLKSDLKEEIIQIEIQKLSFFVHNIFFL